MNASKIVVEGNESDCCSVIYYMTNYYNTSSCYLNPVSAPVENIAKIIFLSCLITTAITLAIISIAQTIKHHIKKKQQQDIEI